MQDCPRRRLATEPWHERAARAEIATGVLESLVAAAGAAAARRTSSRSAGLLALPLLDRFATESPVAADAEPGQTSLSEQAINRRWMNPQVFRQLFNRKNLIAWSYLSHSLIGFA